MVEKKELSTEVPLAGQLLLLIMSNYMLNGNHEKTKTITNMATILPIKSVQKDSHFE